jgi:hypothetical protein
MMLQNPSTLTINCSTAAQLETYVEYVDYVPGTSFTPERTTLTIAAAGTFTLVTTPVVGTDRKIKNITIRNSGTAANTVQILNNATRVTAAVALQATECFQMDANDTWTVMDGSGRVKVAQPDAGPVNGQTLCFRKVQLAAGTAIGTPHFLGTSTGTPGAWAIGAPGMNGRVVTSELGGLPLPATSGNHNYLSQIQGGTTVAANFQWMDLCWLNTITTLNSTVAQAIVTPAFPARDINGAATGTGYCLGLLVHTTALPATTTTINVDYISSTGAASSARLIKPAAIQALNTILPFELGISGITGLPVGDGQGIQSISSIKLSAVQLTGVASLIVYRCLPGMAMQVANLAYINQVPNTGVKLFPGATLLPYNNNPTATTALTASGDVVITQK